METYKNNQPKTSPDIEDIFYGQPLIVAHISHLTGCQCKEWNCPMHPSYGEKNNSNGRFKPLKILISLSEYVATT